MIIYKVTNKINGKIYVGQTVGDLKRRKSVHLSNAKAGREDNYFYNAIGKYGSDNFNWEVLEECNDIDKLNEREEYWIKELNTISPSGYNLRYGGKNSLYSEEHKIKMSESKQGKNHTEESKIGMRKNHANFNGENNPSAKLTEEDVIDIRNWYEEGMLQREIAKIKNITQRHTSLILNYKRWKHI